MVNAAGLAGLWLNANYFVGNGWLFDLIAYQPQHLAIIPSLVLALAFARQRRLAIANLTVFLVGAFALGGFCFNPARESAASDIRVISFNAEHGRSVSDGELKAFLLDRRPDVFLLQEADFKPGSRPMIEDLVGYHVVTKEAICVGTRWPIERFRSFPLKPGSRDTPAVDVLVQTPGGPVRFVSVHLVPTYLDQIVLQRTRPASYLTKATAAQMAQVAALLKAFDDVEEPVVIGGDFNQQPRGPVYRAMRTRFQDTFAEAGNGFGFTIPVSVGLKRIDYIWASGLDIRRAGINSGISSDHRAFEAVLRVRK